MTRLLEWLWRSLTYGSLQPMHRAVGPGTSPEPNVNPFKEVYDKQFGNGPDLPK